VVSFTPRSLYSPGKEPPVPTGWEFGWSPGQRGEEKILDPTGTRNPTPRSSSPQTAAIPTRLSRLLGLHGPTLRTENCRHPIPNSIEVRRIVSQMALRERSIYPLIFTYSMNQSTSNIVQATLQNKNLV
jgi:hypothetical protein